MRALLAIPLLMWAQAASAQPAPPSAPPADPSSPEAARSLPVAEVPPSPKAVSMAEILTRSQEGVSVSVLVDELLDELAYQLSKEDPKPLSPMAVRSVKVSPNLRADLALSAETRLQARLAKTTQLVQIVCTDCRSLRSRVENGEGGVSMGVVRQADLKQLGEELGARVFLDVDLQYLPGPQDPRVTLAARAFRATDGRLLWSTSIRADETTAAVLRSGHKPMSREEQILELERKLEGHSRFVQMLSVGAARLPYDSPKGDVGGETFAYQLQEAFGEQQRHYFGLRGEFFLNTDRLQVAIVEGAFSWRATEKNLNWGELRLNAMSGAVVGDTAQTPMIEAGFDYIMRFRFSLGAGGLYIVPAKFGAFDLGGFGLRARVGLNF